MEKFRNKLKKLLVSQILKGKEYFGVKKISLQNKGAKFVKIKGALFLKVKWGG